LSDTTRDAVAGGSGGGVGGADAGDNAVRSTAACIPGGGIGTPNGKSRTSHWDGRRLRGRDDSSPRSDGRGRTRESGVRADGEARVMAAVKGNNLQGATSFDSRMYTEQRFSSASAACVCHTV
jgi:hypothetical protein